MSVREERQGVFFHQLDVPIAVPRDEKGGMTSFAQEIGYPVGGLIQQLIDGLVKLVIVN
jgi:hypothetical protein